MSDYTEASVESLMSKILGLDLTGAERAALEVLIGLAEAGAADVQGFGDGSVLPASNDLLGRVGLLFSQQVVSPHDAASGLATGKRMHKPF